MMELMEFQVAGETRKVRVLRNERVARDAPIVLLMHGAYQTGATVVSRSGAARLVADTGAVVLAPDGTDRLWRSDLDHDDRGGDIELMETLVAYARSSYGLNATGRVIAAGFSNGGMFAMRLACQRPELINGALSVAGSMRRSIVGCTEGDGHLDRVSFVHGSRDLVINARRPDRSLVGLLIGGSFVRGVLPLHEATERWCDMLELVEDPGSPERVGAATITSWSGGDHDFVLRERVLPGAFHGWVPGATDELRRMLTKAR
ncbi:MAG: hypothetical protein H7123_07955 [Thermoleophilia bacterium]|nr:hypothetical protein [Thermoleophilia bacterium]